MLRRMDRYVFGEVLAPTLVGFLAYTGFMAVRGLVQFSELLVQSEQPLAEAGLVLALSLPHIVVLTLPIAFLLGLLIGIGRLSADSELTALRASGIDLASLYRPIAVVASAIAGITLFLMLAVVPRTNHLLYTMKLRLSSFAFAQRIQPGMFSPEFGGLRVYVEKASADRRELTGLIISDRSNPDEGDRLTLARRGWLELEEDQGRLWLRVEDAETHHQEQGGKHYDVTSFSKQRMVLQDNGPAGLTKEKQIREQTLRELLVRAATQARRPEERRLAMTEVHKKFALPAACLVFGLIGLPLGIVNRRGGRAAGFAVSIAIVLIYYALLATGEARAIEGRMSPGLAMWLPNILLLAFGLFALARIRRDRTVFELNFRAPAKPGTPESAGAAATAPPPPRAAPRRRTMRLPGLLLIDRYVARRFLATFALVVTSIAVLYVLIDYLEISDDIARNKSPFSMVLRYYQAFISPILLDIVPFAFLVAALVTTASLVRSAETTALLSHGVSLHRAAAPLLVMAAVAGVFLFFFAERVVPAAAAESDRLRFLLKGQTPPANGSTGVWVRGDHGRFFASAAYDPASKRVSGLTMLQIDPKTWHLDARMDTERATVVPGRGLIAHGGWVRTFTGPTAMAARRDDDFLLDAPEAAAAFAAGPSDIKKMTFLELRRFIAVRRHAGADTAVLATGLHQKTAGAAAALLLTLVGLPFAFKYGKRGAVAGIGVALFLGLTYLFLTSLFVRFGESGSLPPLLAAWAPNVFFSLGAAWGLLGVRT
ncbi:MAG TPA: LptF/LptG family permease [Thermoanaerobaculia bacterium]|nr:LptF/LptG family permease [Thermoanaerobaculia bacterium]